MPSSWTITLSETEPGSRGALQIPAAAPHAVLCSWLDDDHLAPTKPFSLAPPAVAGSHVGLGVRLLDDALAGRLTQRAAAGTPVQLGQHWFHVAQAPRMDGGVAWVDLVAGADAEPVRSWRVDFLSPAAFRRGRRTSPWPEPSSVLTSLAERWRRLEPVSAPTVTPELASSVWVSDVAGRSEAFALDESVITGFVGSVQYACDGPDDVARAVDSLFRFAIFAGIGSHTAYGLGCTRVTLATEPAANTHPAGS